MTQRHPNLFIIGAPKCGTTALSGYLATHPMVFMSETAGNKEPHFFSSDLGLSHMPYRIDELDRYLDIFSGASDSACYIGEASTLYMYSKLAVPRILEFCPGAKLIVMLRNPLELAESLHNQHAKHHIEVQDFELAWRLQETRRTGKNLPSAFSDGDLLQYGTVAKLGEQMQRLMENVPRDQLHIIFYDDFSRNPQDSYHAMLDWLGLPPDERTEFPRMNSRVNFRYPIIEGTLHNIRRFREALHIPGGIGLHALINQVNIVSEGQGLRPEFQSEMKTYFSSDVELLSNLTGRDLSCWLS